MLQISLGGWTSANYAALACPDFPTCQTQWWPAIADFEEGFVLWRGLGIDYEGGVLDHPGARGRALHAPLGRRPRGAADRAARLAARAGAARRAPDGAAVLAVLLLQLEPRC